MKLLFIPLDYDYKTIEDKTCMLVYGKTSEGKNCCIIDEAINFFYVLNGNEKLLGEIEKIKGVGKAEIVEKNYREKPVKAIKVFCEHSQMQEIAHKIERINPELETRERDLSLVTRYIIESKIKPLVWYEIEGSLISDNELRGISNSLDADLVLKLEKHQESKEQPELKPKVLAFDIETEEFEIGKGEILMISLVSDNFKKVLTWKCEKKDSFVEYFKSEAGMIEAFESYIEKLNPDVITGYFSDGFDLPYLRARAEKNQIDLRLGKDKSRILFSRGRPINARIKGLVHVDLLKFIETVYSQYLQSETLSLNEVAFELLGERKLEIDHNKKSEHRKEEEWKDYFKYNLQDSILTYKLFQKFWPDLIEFTRIIQEPLFSITRYSMSHLVENYFIHNLEKFNEIAEKRPIHEEIGIRREREKYKGAFVLQPEAALYQDLAVFDFTSMYASVIVSFNLSKITYLGEKKQPNAFEVDLSDNQRIYFSKKKGFIPKLLEEIIELRKKYKQELKQKPDAIKQARSNAFKLLANAAYGYNGFFGARWYCPEAAAATAALARKFIKDTIAKTEKAGYKVIYADTDGFSFLLDKKTKQETLNFLKKLNSELPGIMELELEDFYKRGLWVTKRTKEMGAKKKYALINYEGKLKIRGFETVRRDWCNLARELQNQVLEKILKDGDEKSALEYAKKIIKQLKERKINREEIIIRTQLKKPLSEYKAITPHVIAAQKIKEKGEPVDMGMLVSYFIAETREKKKLVREKVKLPEEKGEYNIEYYLKHQILPAIENIFEVFNININELVERTGQKKLPGF